MPGWAGKGQFVNKYGELVRPEETIYGSCHECGKTGELVSSGAAAIDPGSVCRRSDEVLDPGWFGIPRPGHRSL